MTREQLALLKEIKKSGLYDYSHLSADERDILFSLRDRKYIVSKANPYSDERPVYKISELGKSELYHHQQRTFKFWFPLIVSNSIAFIALIISIIALLK